MTQFVVPEFVGTRLFPFAVTYLANGWGVSVAAVGPELAAAMLALNAEEQRNPRPANVRAFARDMANGSWRLTHQAVAFNARGYLFDGQNRLKAVALAGVAVPMVVYFGAGDSEEMAVLDTGGRRNAQDAAKVMGLDADNRDVALVRQMAYADAAGEKFTHAEVIALLDKYGDAVDWVNARMPDRGRVGATPVRSAIGRAFYHCDLDRLSRFVAIYMSEVGRDNGVPAEAVPVVLAKFVQSSTLSRAMAGAYEVRGKALRAIEAFMNGQPIATLVHSPSNGRIYPLPQDPQAKGGAA